MRLPDKKDLLEIASVVSLCLFLIRFVAGDFIDALRWLFDKWARK